MTFQPATGTKDLNPQEVETNRLISKTLSQIYKLWGYEEVSPPGIERIETLIAGGAISRKEIIRLVADEPLGLRPEMTGSIARLACTRFASKARPLRLWANGTVYESKETADNRLSIEENLKSGVEIFGEKNISADIELLSLLLNCLNSIEIKEKLKPILLIGHTKLIDSLLKDFETNLRTEIKESLINYNKHNLETMNIEESIKYKLITFLEYRGSPNKVLNQIETLVGSHETITDLKNIFNYIEPLAKRSDIEIQFDPTFQPHFNLYTGLVFHLSYIGDCAPKIIASGGRYDKLVEECGARKSNASGLGFSFNIDKIRDIIKTKHREEIHNKKVLIAYSTSAKLEDALKEQEKLHQKGVPALVEFKALKTKSMADKLLDSRGCIKLIWIESSK